MPEDFGKRLHLWMLHRQLTQLELAMKCDLTREVVSDLIHGTRPPVPAEIERLAAGLGLTTVDLMYGEPK